jgi:hypothetical protein
MFRGSDDRTIGAIRGSEVQRNSGWQDVDGQPELGESGQLRVPEPVGVAELQPPAGAVGDLDDIAELARGVKQRLGESLAA